MTDTTRGSRLALSDLGEGTRLSRVAGTVPGADYLLDRVSVVLGLSNNGFIA